jgi:hypothetical protein
LYLQINLKFRGEKDKKTHAMEGNRGEGGYQKLSLFNICCKPGE